MPRIDLEPTPVGTDLAARQARARSAMSGFILRFDSLEFRNIAVLPSDARRAPRGIDTFSINYLHVGPIKRDYQNRIVRSAHTSARVLPHRHASVDADYAAALIKKTEAGRVLCATACMGISAKTGRLLATQIQGVSFNFNGYAEGLNDGFLWRHTMVAALAELALLGGEKEMEILGAANNPWKARIEGYDMVAEELGFTYIPETRNWASALPLVFDHSSLPAMHKPRALPGVQAA